MKYSYFEGIVDSDLPLPELRQRPDTDVASLAIAAGVLDESLDVAFRHEWRDVSDQLQLYVGYAEEGWMLEFAGVGFMVDPGLKRIVYSPDPGMAASTVRHLVLDQVLPRVLGHAGALVLHASAVQLETGVVVVLVGKSGDGKSTLAAAAAASGARLIADDCVLLRARDGDDGDDGDIDCVSNYCGLRLFPDSLAALDVPLEATSTFAGSSYKRRYRAGETGGPSTWRVDAIIVLGRDDSGGAPSLDLFAGSASLMSLLEQRFVIDPNDHSTTRAHLQLLSRISRQIPVYKLMTVHDFASLPAILNLLNQLRPPARATR